ncbi:hypothetical protein V8C35DRAFT_221694 [Trichoderma chlorosporum]
MADESGKSEDDTPIDNSIKKSYRNSRITWKNAGGQKKQISKLDLAIYINTNTPAKTAMFKLHTHVTLTESRRRGNRQALYLFIYPEQIHSITTRTSHNTRFPHLPPHLSLHFSLKQKPDLIGPKGRSLLPKGKTLAQLNLFRDLSFVTEFTVHLAGSPSPQDFKLLAQVFSPTNTQNRPRTDEKHGDLASLYTGRGGEVISTNEGIAHDEQTPPPYAGTALSPRSTLNKRRRPVSDVNSDRSSVARAPPFTQGVNILFNDLTRVIKAGFDDILHSINEVKTRVDKLEHSFAEVKDTVADLKTDHTPCRYDTEEREGLLQEATEICQDQDVRFQMASQDVIYDLEKDLEEERDKAIEQVREECNDIITQCKDEVQEAQKDIHTIKARLSESLQHASMRFNGTVVLDFLE